MRYESNEQNISRKSSVIGPPGGGQSFAVHDLYLVGMTWVRLSLSIGVAQFRLETRSGGS